MNALLNKFRIDKTTAVDANASSVTAAFNKEGFSNITMFIIPESGTHATHVITLQDSTDGINWVDTTYTVTGDGNFKKKLCTKKYIRAKVTIMEGSTCIVTIAIIATNI